MDYVLLCRRCAKELLAHFKHPLKHTTNASILLVYDPHTLNTSIHTWLHVANQLERCNTRSDLSPGASADSRGSRTSVAHFKHLVDRKTNVSNFQPLLHTPKRPLFTLVCMWTPNLGGATYDPPLETVSAQRHPERSGCPSHLFYSTAYD